MSALIFYCYLKLFELNKRTQVSINNLRENMRDNDLFKRIYMRRIMRSCLRCHVDTIYIDRNK